MIICSFLRWISYRLWLLRFWLLLHQRRMILWNLPLRLLLDLLLPIDPFKWSCRSCLLLIQGEWLIHTMIIVHVSTVRALRKAPVIVLLIHGHFHFDAMFIQYLFFQFLQLPLFHIFVVIVPISFFSRLLLFIILLILFILPSHQTIILMRQTVKASKHYLLLLELLESRTWLAKALTVTYMLLIGLVRWRWLTVNQLGLLLLLEFFHHLRENLLFFLTFLRLIVLIRRLLNAFEFYIRGYYYERLK